MNKQIKRRAGEIIGRGIEWTDYTWNPIGGCLHACQWSMPDGSIAQCYAKDVAEGVAREHYPAGFEAHYWHGERLTEPMDVATPSRIFCDSMADLFGRWVTEQEINSIMVAIQEAPQHTFQSLTKNPLRLKKVRHFPANLWIGASSPPDSMRGHAMTPEHKTTMLEKTLDTLEQVHAATHNVTWMSIEPLSWNVAPILAKYPTAIRWAVVGAASNGPKVYQPDPGIVREVLAVLDEQQVPVFFKGNLAGNEAAAPWRELFPGYVPTPWNKAPWTPRALAPLGIGHLV